MANYNKFHIHYFKTSSFSLQCQYPLSDYHYFGTSIRKKLLVSSCGYDYRPLLSISSNDLKTCIIFTEWQPVAPFIEGFLCGPVNKFNDKKFQINFMYALKTYICPLTFFERKDRALNIKYVWFNCFFYTFISIGIYIDTSVLSWERQIYYSPFVLSFWICLCVEHGLLRV